MMNDDAKKQIAALMFDVGRCLGMLHRLMADHGEALGGPDQLTLALLGGHLTRAAEFARLLGEDDGGFGVLKGGDDAN